MEMTCKELKRRAREAMGLPRPPFWAVALIYVLVDAGIELLSQLSSAFLAPVLGAFSAFLPILGGLFAVVFSFGYQVWCLWPARRQSPGPGALMQGFSISGRVLWMQVLIVLKLLLACFGWLFVLLLAASVFFPGGVMFLLSAPELTSSLLSYPMSLFIWALALRYALAPYLLADRPEDGAGAAVRRSAGMMKGFKWQLAKLELSFLGWEAVNFLLSNLIFLYSLLRAGLLPLVEAGNWEAVAALFASATVSIPAFLISTLLTVPISLWVLPYRGVARACFYVERAAMRPEDAPPLL